METVLVLTDFSDASEHAMEFALDVLGTHQSLSRILLLNTYFVPSVSDHRVIATHDKMKKTSLEKLAKARSLALTHLKNVKITVETLSRIGAFQNIASDIIHEEKVDLVIMGTNGRKKQDEIFDLLGQNRCPILIVPYLPRLTEIVSKA